MARAVGLLAVLGLVAGAAAPSLWRSSGGGTHTVTAGDSLWQIARDNHTTVAALMAANGLHGDLITIGETLTLPGSGASMILAADTTPLPTAAPATTAYRVRSGDTLDRIARRFGTTTQTLLTLNHLADPNVVVLGSVLRVPAIQTTPTVVVRSGGSDADALAAAVFSPPSPRDAAAVAQDRALLANRWLPTRSQAAAMIRAEALRQGVPVSLALAVATQESGLSQDMVSRTDAVGIMQLMPGTARWLGEDILGVPVDRLDAASNVRAGVAYLRVLLRQTDTRHAIAGYYQGLGNVLKHGMSADTRAYVASVLALQARYS